MSDKIEILVEKLVREIRVEAEKEAYERLKAELLGNEVKGARMLSKEKVATKIGVKPRTIDSLRASEGFPLPRDLGLRMTVWLEDDVDEWIRSRRFRA